ncbi:hypothetical protein HPG69_014427, partial [Diceros bicornis minor]
MALVAKWNLLKGSKTMPESYRPPCSLERSCECPKQKERRSSVSIYKWPNFSPRENQVIATCHSTGTCISHSIKSLVRTCLIQMKSADSVCACTEGHKKALQASMKDEYVEVSLCAVEDMDLDVKPCSSPGIFSIWLELFLNNLTRQPQ